MKVQEVGHRVWIDQGDLRAGAEWRKAIDEGMITLRQSGLRKVKEGVTTIEEVVRETVK